MSAHPNGRSTITGGLLAAAVLLIGSAPAGASAQETDAHWLPWMGCWEAMSGPADAPILCLQPLSDDIGIEMLTVADGEILSRQTVRADGQSHTADREGCQGWERASFSDDSRRVYFRAEFVCDGNVERTSAGLMAMVSPYEWIDVKTVEIAGRSVPFVMRYALAIAEDVEGTGLENIASDRSMALHSARIAAAAPITIEDVVDASSQVDAVAVEAWVAESGEQFTLDADRLIQMADAGVPESVIDVVVAVSYPESFALDRGPDDDLDRVDPTYSGARRDRYGYGYGYGPGRFGGRYSYDPFFMGSYYYPYSGFGFSYSPFGYGRGFGGFGGYGGFGIYRPTVVVVQRRDSGGGVLGRAVRGLGYTRGGSGSSSSGSAARGRSGSSGSSAAGSSSRGSTKSSSGRTAKRRGGGSL